MLIFIPLFRGECQQMNAVGIDRNFEGDRLSLSLCRIPADVNDWVDGDPGGIHIRDATC